MILNLKGNILGKKFTLISLGCSKNLVDSEQILYLMGEGNFSYVENIEDAELCIINTCGFIEDAKKESIETILNVIDYKNNGNLKYIIVVGCLVQRYYNELKEELTEVDAFLGTTSFPLILNVVNGLYLGEKKSFILDAKADLDLSMERNLLTSSHYAYIKIAEGCNNRCTYCIIPHLRGNYRSRSIEDIKKEAENLAENGVKEIILIAQDTSKYGIDIYKEKKLSKLLETLSNIDKIMWIRFLYTYPEDIDEKLINVIKRNVKIVPYFDIPIQHCNDRVLKRMNRRINKKQILEKINLIRNNLENSVIRSTVIVGFPGETHEEFEELESFIKDVKFDKLGVFEYSDEENTPAYKYCDKIDKETKKIRRDKIMLMQKTISEEINKKYIGNSYKVLLDEVNPDYLIGRSYMDVVEVDGVIYIKNNKNNKNHENHKTGDVINVKIVDSLEYDLIGEEL